MFSEKEEAFSDSMGELMMAPMLFWYDIWTGMVNGDKDAGLARAQRKAETRLSAPYSTRVGANRRRLAKGG